MREVAYPSPACISRCSPLSSPPPPSPPAALAAAALSAGERNRQLCRSCHDARRSKASTVRRIFTSPLAGDRAQPDRPSVRTRWRASPRSSPPAPQLCTCSRAVQPCSQRPLTGPADAGRRACNRLAPQLLMTPSGTRPETPPSGGMPRRSPPARSRRRQVPSVEAGPTTAGGRTLGLRRMATRRPAGSSPRQPSRRRRRPAGRSRR